VHDKECKLCASVARTTSLQGTSGIRDIRLYQFSESVRWNTRLLSTSVMLTAVSLHRLNMRYACWSTENFVQPKLRWCQTAMLWYAYVPLFYSPLHHQTAKAPCAWSQDAHALGRRGKRWLLDTTAAVAPHQGSQRTHQRLRQRWAALQCSWRAASVSKPCTGPPLPLSMTEIVRHYILVYSHSTRTPTTQQYKRSSDP
jgi:hypothetical protein